MLVYKTKQHSKQQAGLNYATYFEMTDLKFSLTSQCHKTTNLHIMFKKQRAIGPGIVQQPLIAGSRRLVLKTEGPCVDYRPPEVGNRYFEISVAIPIAICWK